MRLSRLVAIAAGVAVTAVGTADVAPASELSRHVDFSSPGATYDSATIATWPPNGAVPSSVLIGVAGSGLIWGGSSEGRRNHHRLGWCGLILPPLLGARVPECVPVALSR